MRLTDPRLVRYAGATRVFLLAAGAVGLLTAALVIAQATLLADAVARAFGDGATLADLRVPLTVLAVVVAGRAVLAWVGDVLAHRTSAAVTSTLRMQLVGHAIRSRPSRVAADGASASGSRTADLTTVAARGIDALDVYFARYLPALVLAAVVPIVVAVRILVADWASALVIVCTLPLIPLFMVLVGWFTRRHTDRGWRRLAVLSRGFLDLVEGLPTLRVFGRARGPQGQVHTIRRLGEQHRRATMRTLRIAFSSALVLELVTTLSVALVAVGIGLRLVHGSLDLETGLLVLVLAPEAYWPLRHLAAQYHASAEGVAAADRVFGVLDTPLPPSGCRTDAPDPSVLPVHVQGLTVRYAGRDTDAVHQLTLTLAPGRTVALVGPSGSGKSSVLAVLLGFVQPWSGRVLVGDVPLSELDLDAWRRRLAYLPQRPTLFAGTVAENIALGAPPGPPSAVRRAASLAGAAEFVDALPGGFSYRLGDGAAELSAGQRQRIALARVFFRDSDLVLLDEPTANLDADSEALVASAVRRLAVGRTVLLAAHRPALVLDADQMVQLTPAGVAG